MGNTLGEINDISTVLLKRAKFEGGYLLMQMDDTVYTAGSKVSGKIYIRAEVDISPKQLVLEVRGAERASYWAQAGEKTMKIRFGRTMYEFKGTCFRFDSVLEKGDYFINFEFDLPDELPSSMWFKENNYSQRPHAKVLHSVKAILEMNEDSKVMEYEEFLVV